MNPIRWTLFAAGDDPGKVIDAPSIAVLLQHNRVGIRWINRGHGIESINDVLWDLEMSAELAAEREGDRLNDAFDHEADELLEDDDMIDMLWKSLRHFA